MDELIHKYLDGEMNEAEGKNLPLSAGLPTGLQSKQGLTEMQAFINDTKNVLVYDITDKSRLTDKVMTQIETKPRFAGLRFFDFLVQPRSLRWNIASAIAALIIIMVGLSLLIHKPAPDSKEAVAVKTSYQPPVTIDSQIAYVELRLNMPDAKEIAVCGDFNDWKPDEIKLHKAPDSGLWTITIPLSINKTYQYMFVVDGQKWIPDPMVATYLDDGFGGKNSVIDLRNMW